MRTKHLIAVAAFALALASGVAEARFGPQGNDTGGIIPWYPGREARAMARQYAADQCASWGKYAVITSVRRAPGDFIAYECRFPRRWLGTGYWR